MSKKDDSSSPPPASRVKQARCPRCGKSFEYTSVAAHKVFPFCSQRCRDVDLGNWITGKYRVPGPPLPPAENDPDGT